MWLKTTSTDGAINMDHVVSVAPTANAGYWRFTLVTNSYADVHLGADDTAASNALRQLVDSVDIADYGV